MPAQISGNTNFNVRVNDFFTTKYSIISGEDFIYNWVSNDLPNGLYLNSGNGTITGNIYDTGAFNSVIFLENQTLGGSLEDIKNINFNTYNDTGYLYSFGNGDGSYIQYVPQEFENLPVRDISVSDVSNLAVAYNEVYIPPAESLPIVPPELTSLCSGKKSLLSGIPPKYTFSIKVLEDRDIITDFNFTSTLSGSSGCYANNNLFFTYSSGTLGASSEIMILSSGYIYNKDIDLTNAVSSLSSGCVLEISAGHFYSVALLNNGTVTGWGYNNYGQTTGGSGLAQVKAISAGGYHVIALLNNDRITGWGENSVNQALGGNALTGVEAISAGHAHSIALLNNGRVTGWGINTSNQALGGNTLTGVKAISAGRGHSLALLNNGRVTGWGNNIFNCALGGNGLTGVSGISAANDFSIALLNNGRVTGWGHTLLNKGNGGNGLTGVKSISASIGGSHSIALLNNGTVTGWGYNNYNQALGGNLLTGTKKISAGAQHSIALLDNGTVTGWGYNNYNQALGGSGLGNC